MTQGKPKVFIIHGHAELATLRIKEFVRRLGLEPVVLEDEDDLGLTIIEKFDHYARPCVAAITLLTSDDLILPSKGSQEIFASRPNVLIEFGWFIRHVGRSRVLTLYQKGTNVPSDLAGVLTLQFAHDPLEATEKIRQRMEGIGLL